MVKIERASQNSVTTSSLSKFAEIYDLPVATLVHAVFEGEAPGSELRAVPSRLGDIDHHLTALTSVLESLGARVARVEKSLAADTPTVRAVTLTRADVWRRVLAKEAFKLERFEVAFGDSLLPDEERVVDARLPAAGTLVELELQAERGGAALSCDGLVPADDGRWRVMPTELESGEAVLVKVRVRVGWCTWGGAR